MNDLKYNYSLQDILEADNVATLVEEEDLRLIGSNVVDNYDADKSTRADWEDRIEEALDLALQVVEEKSTPWPGAANVKYPLLSTAALQFSARAYPALVPGFNVVKGRVLGYDPDGTKTREDSWHSLWSYRSVFCASTDPVFGIAGQLYPGRCFHAALHRVFHRRHGGSTLGNLIVTTAGR